MSTYQAGETIKGGAFDGFEVLSTYSRAQAILDGVLIDVTPWASACGFKYPCAFTSGLWARLERGGAWEDDGKGGRVLVGVDAKGRARGIFDAMHDAIKNCAGNTDRIDFSIRGPEFSVDGWSVCGPGDDERPVLTVMLRGED